MKIKVLLCTCLLLSGLVNVNTQKKIRNGTRIVWNKVETFILNIIANSVYQRDNDNVVLSPFSIWSTLCTLSEGASGKTLENLTNFTRIAKIDKEVLRQTYSQLEKLFNFQSSSVHVESSNFIIIDKGITLRPEYPDIVKNIYHVKFHQADFSDPDALKTINNLVQKQTHNKIQISIKPADVINASMIISNALFFQGDWSQPFDSSATRKEPFFDKNDNILGYVNMMSKKAPYLFVYHKELQADLIEMPYGGNNELCMIVIVPKKGVDLKDVLNKFQKIHIRKIFKSFDDAKKQDKELSIQLPRFSITSDLIMDRILLDVGLYHSLAPDEADFSLISPNKKLHLSALFHKVKIDVTEKSARSGALISIDTRLGEKNDSNKTAESVKINRPFIFLIAERQNGLIVIGGSYVKPKLF